VPRKRPGTGYGLAIVVLIGVAVVPGCGDQTDDLARLTRCLRGEHARTVASPALSEFATRRDWKVGRFFLGNQGVTVFVTSSETDGGNARRQVVEAMATLGERGPPPQRRGKILYWWDHRPSPSNKAAVDRCIHA
jgi:hypothetical protein